MNRIRCLVNAELLAEDSKGKEHTVQFGAGTNFEAKWVHTYESEGEQVADIALASGLVVRGVTWNQRIFENQGVPETKVKKPVVHKETKSETKAE